MKYTILIGLLLSVVVANCQMPTGKVRIANNTFFVPGKSSFRIVTSEDTITRRLMYKFEKIIDRATSLKKDDRYGSYWENSFYFKNENYNTIVEFINNGFK